MKCRLGSDIPTSTLIACARGVLWLGSHTLQMESSLWKFNVVVLLVQEENSGHTSEFETITSSCLRKERQARNIRSCCLQQNTKITQSYCTVEVSTLDPMSRNRTISPHSSLILPGESENRIVVIARNDAAIVGSFVRGRSLHIYKGHDMPHRSGRSRWNIADTIQ